MEHRLDEILTTPAGDHPAMDLKAVKKLLNKISYSHKIELLEQNLQLIEETMRKVNSSSPHSDEDKEILAWCYITRGQIRKGLMHPTPEIFLEVTESIKLLNQLSSAQTRLGLLKAAFGTLASLYFNGREKDFFNWIDNFFEDSGGEVSLLMRFIRWMKDNPQSTRLLIPIFVSVLKFMTLPSNAEILNDEIKEYLSNSKNAELIEMEIKKLENLSTVALKFGSLIENHNSPVIALLQQIQELSTRLEVAEAWLPGCHLIQNLKHHQGPSLTIRSHNHK